MPAGNGGLRHFPCLEDGQYSGHHPADDAEAIEQLELLRASGAALLVIPTTSMWWLAHYSGFAEHLRAHYSELFHDPETAVIYSLSPVSIVEPDDRGDDRVAALLAERESLRRRLRDLERTTVPNDLSYVSARLDRMEDLIDELIEPHADVGDGVAVVAARERSAFVRHSIPRGCHVLEAGPPGSAVTPVAGRQITRFPLDAPRADRSPSTDRTGAIARLESSRATCADFLLIPETIAQHLGSFPRFADHLVGRYGVMPAPPSMLLFDLRERQFTAPFSSRAVSAVVERISRIVDGDAAVLDWTRGRPLGELGVWNVFRIEDGSTLPYLDSTFSIVLIDDPTRLEEAARVASAAVVSVATELRPLSVRVQTVDQRVEDELATAPRIRFFVNVATPDPVWLRHLHEALDNQYLVDVVDGSNNSWSSAEADVVAVIEEGVLPLPGCVEAARFVLRAGDVGAVAPKLFNADGTLEAAGVTIYSDGSSAGIANGSSNETAAWHEYLRDTCAGAGLLFVSPQALVAAQTRGFSPAAHPAEWAAVVWASGQRVVYQPESEAVRVATFDQASVPAASEWAPTLRGRPERSEHLLEESYWRHLLATDDVHGSWTAMLDVAR